MYNKDKYKVVIVKNANGIPERRIKALRDGKYFNKGDLGAIIDEESSLSQYDDSWATEGAKIEHTMIGGDSDLLITGSSVMKDCQLVDVNGVIMNSSVARLKNDNNDVITVRIKDSKIEIADIVRLKNNTVLHIDKSTIRCKHLQVSGNISIVNSMIGDSKALLKDCPSLCIDQSEIIGCGLPESDFIQGCRLYKSRIYGSAYLNACEITNSTLEYSNKPYKDNEELSKNMGYMVNGACISGAQPVCHSGDEIHLLSGITISGLIHFDLASTIIRTNEDAIVARVPGTQWYIESTSRRYFDHKTQVLPGITTDSLIAFFNATKTADARLAKSIIRLCIQCCQSKIDRFDRLKFMALYATFGIRTRIKKLFSL